MSYSLSNLLLMISVGHQERINRGHFYKTPHYVGFKILICGKKDSHFPFQLFVSST